jgi:hypothetical protein
MEYNSTPTAQEEKPGQRGDQCAGGFGNKEGRATVDVGLVDRTIVDQNLVHAANEASTGRGDDLIPRQVFLNRFGFTPKAYREEMTPKPKP